MLNPRKENVVANKDYGVNEQVELKCDISKKKQDNTPIQSIKEEKQDYSEKGDA